MSTTFKPADQTASSTASQTLVASDSGTTYFLNAAAGQAVSLPSPADGLRFRFIVATAPTSNTTTVVATAAVIEGSVTVAGLVIAGANETTITFTANAALVGDWCELISDGTSWFISGQATASTGIALT